MTAPGGVDSVFHGDGRSLALLCLRAAWPEAVVDEEDGSSQLFVYRDAAAREAWHRDGWSKENAATMVHILFYQSPGCSHCTTTVVTEQPCDGCSRTLRQVYQDHD